MHYLEYEKQITMAEVNCYEKGYLPKHGPNKAQPMIDISARMSYEWAKIKLEAMETKDKFEYIHIFKFGASPFHEWPKIRIASAVMASDGRTTKITELTEEELKKAREIANKKVDEWFTNFRKRLA